MAGVELNPNFTHHGGTRAPLPPGPPLDTAFRSGLIYNQMVVDELRELELDRLFQAFSDSTRRDMLRRVGLDGLSVSGLGQHYDMSFAAVQKHVAVLERASLVTKEKRGREQIVRADRNGLHKAQRLLENYEAIWRARVDRIATILAEDPHDDSYGKAVP
ncbi:DNA-binding transcriptional ArsR family regulator [Arthrobacter sp. UYCu511]